MDDKIRDLMIGLSGLVLISFLASLIIHPVAIVRQGEALWVSLSRWPVPRPEAQKVEPPNQRPIVERRAPEPMIPGAANPFPNRKAAYRAKPIPLHPEAWVMDDDYPAEALRSNWQGTVIIRWTVGSNGRAMDCRVVQGSGYPVLDEASCDAIMKRARYSPVYDLDGRPMSSEDQRRIVWRLPD